METQKKKLTPEQALLKAQKYCAYQERCQQEMRDKLYEWGLATKTVEQIIAELISDNFINEERFAKAYAGGKFRIKKWGKVKIKLELKKRKISDYSIRKGLSEINEGEYLKTIETLIAKKSREIKDKNTLIRNHKIARAIATKGFEQDIIWDLLKGEE